MGRGDVDSLFSVVNTWVHRSAQVGKVSTVLNHRLSLNSKALNPKPQQKARLVEALRSFSG